MASCLTITLNPAVDATYVVRDFELGGANRVNRLYRMPGGKGNNVARVLRTPGHRVTATGFLGGHNGRFIDAGLQEAGIATHFVWLEGRESRTCHAILDADSGIATEVLEAGPDITDEERDELLRRLPALARGTDAVVISGSAPAGTPQAFLESVAGIVRKGTDRMVVDTSGDTLDALLTGHPDLIKPNATELDALIGSPASERQRIAFARDDLIAGRMAADARVLVSQGSEGAVLVSRNESLRAQAPSIRPVNTVGCGDAMLAGFVNAWLDRASNETALRRAVAFGTAAALQPVAGVIDKDDIERLIPDVVLAEAASTSGQGRDTT